MTYADDSGTGGPGVVDREFDTERADPNVEVVSAIADLEDKPVEELPPLYMSIDHILEDLYAEPPRKDANVRISFSYYGYRITVKQDGSARFERPDRDRSREIDSA